MLEKYDVRAKGLRPGDDVVGEKVTAIDIGLPTNVKYHRGIRAG